MLGYKAFSIKLDASHRTRKLQWYLKRTLALPYHFEHLPNPFHTQRAFKMASTYTKKLQNQRVLIIGGTAGIGYAVAEGAVEFGAHVTVASSQQENVDNAVKKLKESYPDASTRIQGHVCNTNSDECEANLIKAMDFATNNKSTKLDHIVDTAGGTPGPHQARNCPAFRDLRLHEGSPGPQDPHG